MNRFFLGIDPGFTGAVACYCPELGILNVQDMPVIKNSKGKTVINHTMLFEMFRPVTKVVCMLELVASRPGQGASATFRFGQGFGAIEMALAAHRIPTHYTTPASWKRYFKLSKDKGASRGLATQRFPDNAELFARVKDDGRAEAALIALYAAETLVKVSATP